MLKNIPKDFEFECCVDGSRTKISEVCEIRIAQSGRLIFMVRDTLDTVIFRDKVEENRGATLQKGTEDFDRVVFECYLQTVLK